MQQESGLFEVRFNEEGKKYIRRFVSISYTLLVLVIFECAISIYWNIKFLIASHSIVDAEAITPAYADIISVCVSISFSLIAIVSNLFYIRFPRVLLRKIELNDEQGANRAFSLLFKGAFIFLIWLFLSTVSTIWTLIRR